VQVQIIFYSMYGHVYRMAEAVAEGARQVDEAKVGLWQVEELVPLEVLKRTGADQARRVFAHVPTAQPEQMVEADALIFGTPTRFGMMCAQMRNFLDRTGQLWAQGSLIGKVGSVFTSTATQHGGQEATILSFHTTLLHHGLILVGVPYSESGLMVTNQVSGGTPYGASTLAGPHGKRNPSENELAIARAQGQRVAQIALDLKRGREK